MKKFDKHILKNGMVVLGEPMEQVQSVAFDFFLPAGAAQLPNGCCGASSIIADWIFRGAGKNDSRQLSDALDSLGLHRATSVGSSHIIPGAILLADNLAKAIELYADVICRPQLKKEQFELSRQSAIDCVLALDDDPRAKVMLKLREQFYPDPLGRSTLGNVKDLNSLTAEKTGEIIKEKFELSQTIFAVAGKYDFAEICEQMEELFGGGEIKQQKKITIKPKQNKYTHIDNDGAQVHIGLMTKTVKPDDADYYNARIAVSVLSGSMSARLFTEVREKRGLCYAIGAKYHGLKDAAGIMCYAGTMPEKAQETLDVIMNEFNRLSEGISAEEIARAKVGLKSALILQSESSGSRATAIGSDYYVLGKIRGLDEIKAEIEKVNVDSVLGFLRKNKFREFSVVTIGPKKVKLYPSG
ncbi:MAG: insulinase family protein [Planctomycetes bacterium]|nr:insulinase family protein [Planctomycetota bacterium]